MFGMILTNNFAIGILNQFEAMNIVFADTDLNLGIEDNFLDNFHYSYNIM